MHSIIKLMCIYFHTTRFSETKTQTSVELTGQQSVDSGNITITTEPPIPEEPSEAEPEIEIVPKSEVSS